MSRTFGIPGEGRWFEGHFPGRPILPGVSLLALVADALGLASLRRIAHARFRRTIGPGERLVLDAIPQGEGAWRVAIGRGGTPVMTAELVAGAPEAAGQSALELTDPIAAPSLDELLPHRAPMRFVNGVLALRDDGIDCSAALPGACALVRDGVAPAHTVVEAAAQAAAAWEALRRRLGGGAPGPRAGYLVALRDVSLHAAHVPAETALVASVRLAAVAMPLTRYRAEVALGGATVMTGTIATVLAPDPSEGAPMRTGTSR